MRSIKRHQQVLLTSRTHKVRKLYILLISFKKKNLQMAYCHQIGRSRALAKSLHVHLTLFCLKICEYLTHFLSSVFSCREGLPRCTHICSSSCRGSVVPNYSCYHSLSVDILEVIYGFIQNNSLFEI